MRTTSRPRGLALLGASLVFSVTSSAVAAAPVESEAQPPPAPVETPSTGTEATPEEVVAPAADDATAQPPTAEAAPAEPPADGPTAADPAPEEAATVPTPPPAIEEPAAESGTPREGSDSAVPADPPEEVPAELLKSKDEAPLPPPRSASSRTTVQDPGAQDAAIVAAFNRRYRPDDNPGRLHLAGRLLFANAGGDNEIGGRMGGAQIDVGQGWNRIGYAVTATAWGGRILLSDRVAEMNAMFGIGPTLTMGRLTLQQRGMIDLRLGYDFMYSVVNQRSDTASAIVAPQGDSGLQLQQTQNLLPHGPRAMLQLGLVSPKNRRYFHGFGVLMGYQGLVGSLRGELPFTHMLMTGVQWWMG